MVPASSSTTAPAAAAEAARTELSVIDASTRGPVLLFLVCGALWLLVSSALALIASVQLHNPSFFNDAAWLTYGRMRPAATNAFIYGWGFNAAFAVTLWLMARLAHAPVRGGALAVVGGLFWNLAVAGGVVAILAAGPTGFDRLEMPPGIGPVLFVAYALIGAVTIATFRFKRWAEVYVSQWYLLAALFWFPWLFSIAQVMLFHSPTRGVTQAIVAAWYGFNVYGLWLAPVALAAIYYFLPKLLGRSINDYAIARMGFWTWALFASFAGVRQLIGGPVPAWVQAAGAAAALMLLIPVVVIGINTVGTLNGRMRALKGGPTLPFITAAVGCFLLSGVGLGLTSLRTVAEVTQFTFVTPALVQLEVYGVFTFAAFGAIYFLLPRLLRREWPSAALITAHFWATLAGLALVVLCLLLGGLLQGAAMNNAEAYPEYVDVVRRTVPFLVGQSLGLVVLAIGHLAFAANLALMLVRPRVAADRASVLFRQPPALEVVS